MARLRFLLPTFRAAASSSRPPRTPRSPTSKRSTRTVRTAATCSTATGCSGSTPPIRASSSAGCAARRRRAGARSRSRTCGTSATRRTSRWRAGSAGTARTSSCRARTARWRGPSASSRSTTARGCGSTARRSARTPARTSRSRSRPRTRSSARGTNRLVVRVDSKRLDSDFPPARTNADGVPSGGWWNYSGIQREVYLKKLDTVDFQRVQVRPEIACGTCDASVRMDLNLRNVTARGQRVTVTGKFGDRNVNFGSQDDRGGRRSPRSPSGSGSPSRACGRRRPRTSTTSPSPSAWTATRSRATACTAASARSRSPRASLFLNGAPINIRGMGLHEDSKAAGFAIDNARREELVNLTKEAGGTVLRTHYPFHPYTHELADRLGPADLGGDPGLQRPDAGAEGARGPARRRSTS